MAKQNPGEVRADESVDRLAGRWYGFNDSIGPEFVSGMGADMLARLEVASDAIEQGPQVGREDDGADIVAALASLPGIAESRELELAWKQWETATAILWRSDRIMFITSIPYPASEAAIGDYMRANGRQYVDALTWMHEYRIDDLRKGRRKHRVLDESNYNEFVIGFWMEVVRVAHRLQSRQNPSDLSTLLARFAELEKERDAAARLLSEACRMVDRHYDLGTQNTEQGKISEERLAEFNDEEHHLGEVMADIVMEIRAIDPQSVPFAWRNTGLEPSDPNYRTWLDKKNNPALGECTEGCPRQNPMSDADWWAGVLAKKKKNPAENHAHLYPWVVAEGRRYASLYPVPLDFIDGEWRQLLDVAFDALEAGNRAAAFEIFDQLPTGKLDTARARSGGMDRDSFVVGFWCGQYERYLESHQRPYDASSLRNRIEDIVADMPPDPKKNPSETDGQSSRAKSAVSLYKTFWQLDPTAIGEFKFSSLPATVSKVGPAKWITYRSGKKDPETLELPKKPVDYIHTFGKGVRLYIPDARGDTSVPADLVNVEALTLLGDCTGWQVVQDGERREAQGTKPYPELYAIPSGKALYVIQDKSEILGIFYGGQLGVEGRGIVH